MVEVRGDRTPVSTAALGPLVEVSSRRFALPFQCPCCGAAPDAEIAIPVARDNVPAELQRSLLAELETLRTI